MQLLLKKIKTKEQFESFKNILFERMNANRPISDNPMIDGMIISFILTVKFTEDLFLQKEMGCVLDGTLQKLEQIIIWCSNNEREIISLIDNNLIK